MLGIMAGYIVGGWIEIVWHKVDVSSYLRCNGLEGLKGAVQDAITIANFGFWPQRIEETLAYAASARLGHVHESDGRLAYSQRAITDGARPPRRERAA